MSMTHKSITMVTYPNSCIVTLPPSASWPHTHGTLLLNLLMVLTFDPDDEDPKGSQEVYAGRVQALNNYLFSSGIVYRNPEGMSYLAANDTHVYGFFGDNDKFIPIFQVDILHSKKLPHAVIRHINPNEI